MQKRVEAKVAKAEVDTPQSIPQNAIASKGFINPADKFDSSEMPDDQECNMQPVSSIEMPSTKKDDAEEMKKDGTGAGLYTESQTSATKM